MPKAKPQSMFLALDDVELKLNLLLYGREGTGKTTSLAHAANHGKILVINAEGGLKAGALRRLGINTKNIVVWPKPDTPITYESLDALYRQIQSDLIDDPNSWYLIGLDSVTDILETLTKNVSDARISKQRGFGNEINQYEAFETDRNDYGVMGKQFVDIVRKMRDLPCHFVMTALERRDTDDDTGLTTYGPGANPGIQSKLLGYVDMALYFRAEDPEEDKPYRALTKPTRRYRAKDRLNVLPRILANPTFDRILGYAEEELSADTDPLQAQVAQTEAEPTKKNQADEADNKNQES